MSKQNYDSLGVSASKSGLHEVLERVGVAGDEGLFAKINSDFAGDLDFCSVVHCDGAGTKTIVPYLYYRETGNRELFAGLAQDALVMNLDDVYCIGAPEHIVLANTIGRNSNLIDDEILGVIIASYKNLCSQLSKLGVPIELSGGETADCGDVVRTLMVDAVTTARLKRSELVYASNIAVGDVIVALASTGQASYETQENSGIGSNGLTLARHCLLSHEYVSEYPEVVDPNLSVDNIYQGRFRVTDTHDSLPMDIGTALASPTRTFSPLLAQLIKKIGSEIHGIIHNTGGGLTKMLRFGSGKHFVKDNLFPTPPLFSLIQDCGNVDWKEMYQVFNMGQRLEIYLPESLAETVTKAATSFNIESRIIGRVEKHSEGIDAKNTLTVKADAGEFEYSI